MIAKLLISSSVEGRVKEIEKILTDYLQLFTGGAKLNHPDVLYFPSDSKLGIEQARKIKEFFSLKPYSAKGRAVILEDASELTDEAQSALLKILEEPPLGAIIILGASSDVAFLPTILSRCEVIKLAPQSYDTLEYHSRYIKDLEKLIPATIEERFEYIENLKDREEFLHALLYYFHHNLASHVGNTDYINFLEELLQAEKWAKQNVNIRAILEYLMLKMPSSSSNGKTHH